MAKVQGKKAAAAGKSAAKKVAAKVKAAAGAVKKKAAPKKSPAPAKTAARKPAKAVAKPVKPAKKPAAKPATKAAAKVKAAAKSVRNTTKKAVGKATKPSARPKKVAKAPVKVAKPAKPAAKQTAAKPVAKAAAKPAVKQPVAKPVKAAPKPSAAPAAAQVPAIPSAPPSAAEPEKKRGRRARPRVQSNGIPTAAWLTSEKPRPASFIPAPARAEAPSAIAAPPASSDRLIRPEDVVQSAIRSVPVRIDIEQGAGRFYVLSNPIEATVRVGEGIEWDFRYIGGADVTAEEIVIEFPKPSPFGDAVFRTRKPGGARPHRQASGAALPAAAGKRIEYTVRAMTPFKTELANAKVYVSIV